MQAICPHCQATYKVQDELRGRVATCAKCRQRFLLGEDQYEGVIDAEAAPLEPEFQVAEVVDDPRETMSPRSGGDAAPTMRARRVHRRRKPNVFVPIAVIGGTCLVVLITIGIVIYFLVTLNSIPPKAPVVRGPGPGPQEPAEPGDPFEDDGNADTRELASFEIRDLGEPNSMFVTYPKSPVPNVPLAKSGAAKERQLDAEVLQKVKQATAYLSVRRPEGFSEGSGFVCFDRGYVFTNAHVVGMTNPGAPFPDNVDVVMNSGEANERRFRGRVLNVDRAKDLAVVRILGNNLPEPLPLVSSLTLQETQSVFVVGFPFGSSLGKNVTVSPSSISSLRREDGVLVRLQLAGGMNPGNSGGPVVDAEGRVVGVSVAGIANTGINFAVPSDFVYELFHGTSNQLIALTPVRTPQGIRLPVSVTLFDLLSRIKQARIDYWVGDPGPERPGSLTPPSAQPGDGDRQSVALTIGNRLAQGELTLPPLPNGKAYWLQVCLEGNEARHKRWLSAKAFQPQSILEPTTAVVASKEVGQARVEFLSRSRFHLRMAQSDSQFAMHIRQQWAERNQGQASPRNVSNFELGFRNAERAIPMKNLGQLMLVRSQHFANQGGDRPDVSKLGQAEQRLQAGMEATLSRWLAALDLQLPDIDLARKKEWKQTQPLPLEFVIGTQTENQMDLIYRYLGTLQDKDRPVAVVGVTGEFAKGNHRNTGALRGQAHFDLATGRVVALQALLEAEVEGASTAFFGTNLFDLNHSSLAGTWEFRLRRTFDDARTGSE